MRGIRKDSIRRPAARASLIVCAALLTLAPAAGARTYAPNKLGDNPAGGFSLREAITAANNHAGPDKIILRAGKVYRLALANTAGEEDLNATGDLDIADAGEAGLAITSDGRALATVDAQQTDRVFETLSAGVFIRLKIRGGSNAADPLKNGGGITGRGGPGSDGAIVLRRSTVTGNSARDGGGIEVGSGGLVAVRSVISGNRADHSGGGLYAEDGPASIAKSTIKNNVADADADGNGDSGGAENEDSMTIRSSTISGNSTSGMAGGGGIGSSYGTLRLVNTTIANNAATNPAGVGGGGLVSSGSTALYMNAVTIARNSSAGDAGGFDHDGGTLTIVNSIIAGNTAPSAPNCQGGAGVASLGHNRVGDDTNCLFAATATDRVDLLPSQIRIGRLADNGGPTKTIALKKGSVAIDKAGNDAPGRDQRGRRRNDRGGPDIGAYELTD